MQTYDKIYKIASIINCLIHILLFIFVVIVGFLPYRENQNFYEVLTGFLGEKLSVIQPCLILSILFLTCIGAFFAIKRPAFSVLVLILSFSFFMIIVFPYYVEAAIVSFSSPWIDTSMTSYKIGFSLVVYASNVIYVDLIFVIYSFVTLFVRNRKI